MANRERGEVSLTVGDRTYTLRPTLTAYCELEDLMDMTHIDVLRAANKGSAKALRALVWSYLQAEHADVVKEPEEAGRIIDEAGQEHVEEQIRKMMQANEPPKDDEKDGKPQRPTRKRGGRSGLSGVPTTSLADVQG